MPVHDGSGSNQDERLPPPRPERSQRNPEQLVQGSQSSARPLRVQSEQLPTESQVFEGKVLAGAQRADDPPEEMPERHNHGENSIGTIRIQLCAKSFILQMYDVLARHNMCVVGGVPVERKSLSYWMPILWRSCAKRGSPRRGSAMGSTPRYTRRSLRSR